MKYGRRKRKRRQARTSTASTASAWAAKPAEATEGSASRQPIKPWWEQTPERLECELAELQAAGITYRVDEAAKSLGLLIIDLEITTEQSDKLQLKVRFPDVYPYFRFDILAPNLDLAHHQHPFGKQLCVLGRATVEWDTTNTLTCLIQDQVPRVLSTGRATSTHEVADQEAHQGEPFSDYYSYNRDSMILIDGLWSIDKSITDGTFTLGLDDEQLAENLRGAILRICDRHGNVLAEAEPALASHYRKRVDARWVRVTQPIAEDDPNAFLEVLRSQHETLRKPLWRVVAGGNIDIVGVIFPEEHSWRGSLADGWLLVVQVRKHGPKAMGGTYLARVGRAGRADLTSRVPELSGLQQKKIAIVGCGAVGAPSAIEFARSGIGTVRLLDFDYVDPATAVRWPLGIPASGKAKVGVLKEFVEKNFPYTAVQPFVHRIGSIRDDPKQPHELSVFQQIMRDVDLVYDATAEIGINHFLSDLAAEYKVPYICVSTTHGSWGGRLIRIRPNGITSGCWMCHQWAIQTGLIPIPRSDPKGEVQPAGCADPTFTGSGFDITSIALAGVRLAIGTMQGSVATGYPDVAWDVVVINLRDDAGRVTIPQWEVFQVVRHPSCKNDRAHFPGHGVASTAGG